MALKRESKLWKRLKNLNLNAHIFRVESNTINGIPDVHCVMKGKSFWLELKVHRLNSLNKIALRPHQIAWQIRYSRYSGNVWNLVGHPSSRTINIFRGARAMELTEKRTKDDPLIPDWSSGIPYDWTGAINHILSGMAKRRKTEKNCFALDP